MNGELLRNLYSLIIPPFIIIQHSNFKYNTGRVNCYLLEISFDLKQPSPILKNDSIHIMQIKYGTLDSGRLNIVESRQFMVWDFVFQWVKCDVVTPEIINEINRQYFIIQRMKFLHNFLDTIV